jgi:hypothetical protein
MKKNVSGLSMQENGPKYFHPDLDVCRDTLGAKYIQELCALQV